MKALRRQRGRCSSRKEGFNGQQKYESIVGQLRGQGHVPRPHFLPRSAVGETDEDTRPQRPRGPRILSASLDSHEGEAEAGKRGKQSKESLNTKCE